MSDERNSLPWADVPENTTARTNNALLNTIAEVSGGSVLTKPEDALKPIVNPGETISELWPLFVILAALLLPFDVAVRRLALPFKEIAISIWYKITGRNRPPSEVIATVGRLQQAKMRVSPTDGQEPVAVQPSVTPVRRTDTPIPTVHVSAATRLLEERRKRKQQDEP